MTSARVVYGDPGERVAAEVGDGHRVILRVISHNRLEEGHHDDRQYPVSTLPVCSRSSWLRRALICCVSCSAFINTLLSAEADAVCGAEYGTRQPGADQPPQRLPAPRLRHPGRHPRRRDPQAAAGHLLPGVAARASQARRAALTSVVATCYLLGVSTRRMDKLVQSLGITRLSKSQVSQMANELDAHVEEFRTRPLADAGPFTFVAADALVLKVREGGRVVPVMPWSPPASTLTGTGRSSASRSPPPKTEPAGWRSSAT